MKDVEKLKRKIILRLNHIDKVARARRDLPLWILEELGYFRSDINSFTFPKEKTTEEIK